MCADISTLKQLKIHGINAVKPATTSDTTYEGARRQTQVLSYDIDIIMCAESIVTWFTGSKASMKRWKIGKKEQHA